MLQFFEEGVPVLERLVGRGIFFSSIFISEFSFFMFVLYNAPTSSRCHT